MIGNGLEQKVLANPLNDNFNKREFQELWNRINFKQAYTVHFDDGELRRKAIANIDRNLTVSKVSYRVVTGEQQATASEKELEAGTHFAVQHTETRELAANGAVHVKYDLIGEVARRARITRRSAAEILAGISAYKFRMFQDNPEEFIVKVADAIVDEKATMIVEHISYNQLRNAMTPRFLPSQCPRTCRVLTIRGKTCRIMFSQTALLSFRWSGALRRNWTLQRGRGLRQVAAFVPDSDSRGRLCP